MLVATAFWGKAIHKIAEEVFCTGFCQRPKREIRVLKFRAPGISKSATCKLPCPYYSDPHYTAYYVEEGLVCIITVKKRRARSRFGPVCSYRPQRLLQPLP